MPSASHTGTTHPHTAGHLLKTFEADAGLGEEDGFPTLNYKARLGPWQAVEVLAVAVLHRRCGRPRAAAVTAPLVGGLS